MTSNPTNKSLPAFPVLYVVAVSEITMAGRRRKTHREIFERKKNTFLNLFPTHPSFHISGNIIYCDKKDLDSRDRRTKIVPVSFSKSSPLQTAVVILFFMQIRIALCTNKTAGFTYSLFKKKECELSHGNCVSLLLLVIKEEEMKLIALVLIFYQVW